MFAFPKLLTVLGPTKKHGAVAVRQHMLPVTRSLTSVKHSQVKKKTSNASGAFFDGKMDFTGSTKNISQVLLFQIMALNKRIAFNSKIEKLLYLFWVVSLLTGHQQF